MYHHIYLNQARDSNADSDKRMPKLAKLKVSQPSPPRRTYHNRSTLFAPYLSEPNLPPLLHFYHIHPDLFGRLILMKDILIDHFARHSKGDSSTRVIVFSQLRATVQQVMTDPSRVTSLSYIYPRTKALTLIVILPNFNPTYP